MTQADIRYRTNEQIRGVYQVRLIDSEGKMIGIMPFREAFTRAQGLGMDLVEINRNSSPPVCKILNYGKFKYDTAKAVKEARKKQHIAELKELTLRPVTDTHDLLVKAKHAKGWLEDGDKVKIIVKMKGRERVHPEQGTQVIRELLTEIGPHKMQGQPQADGRYITVIIEPG
jgi:translation initiation factor IF-3